MIAACGRGWAWLTARHCSSDSLIATDRPGHYHPVHFFIAHTGSLVVITTSLGNSPIALLARVVSLRHLLKNISF